MGPSLCNPDIGFNADGVFGKPPDIGANDAIACCLLSDITRKYDTRTIKRPTKNLFMAPDRETCDIPPRDLRTALAQVAFIPHRW